MYSPPAQQKPGCGASVYGVEKRRSFRREKIALGKIQNPVPLPPLFEPEKNIVFPLFGKQLTSNSSPLPSPANLSLCIRQVPDEKSFEYKGVRRNVKTMHLTEAQAQLFDASNIEGLLGAFEFPAPLPLVHSMIAEGLAQN